ncbi:PQQ-binding-like beta-propeller repeat protein [Actinoallomurus sp. CA-142502]|uniref:outer membrane protein assembly factor BamB family protein n=1 Tax=Actinoallomurus sp. CA-142502 TaxID=3239885 RepID=UPI003D8C993E
MTDDSEPRPRPSSTTPRVETVMSWTVDEPAVRQGPWWRLGVVVAALIAVVLAFWGAPRLWAVFADGMRGPYGRFPQPVAAQPPVRSARPVASVPRSTVIYGGLAIMPARDGVRAVDIVTGRVYWRYPKGKGLPVGGVDRSAGDVFLESTSGELVRVDIRSGRIRWSRKVPGIGTDRSVVPDADAATLAFIGSDGMSGISRTTGKVRWTTKWPGTCPYDSDFSHVTVVPGTLAIACNDYGSRNNAVVGFDPATGTTRWVLRVSQLSAGASRPSDMVDTLGLVGGRLAVANDDTTSLLDPATGRVMAERRWKDQPVAFAGGLQINVCMDKKDEAICGYDPVTGAELWRSPSGHIPQLGESLAVADGRVYVVSEVSRNGTAVRELAVFDGRTGRVLGRSPITGEADYVYGPVTDGVIAVGGGFYTDLYAERPDIRSPRRLPS